MIRGYGSGRQSEIAVASVRGVRQCATPNGAHPQRGVPGPLGVGRRGADQTRLQREPATQSAESLGLLASWAATIDQKASSPTGRTPTPGADGGRRSCLRDSTVSTSAAPLPDRSP